MAGGVSSTSFFETLQDFINLILGGGVPDKVHSCFFGTKLHALRKKDGGSGSHFVQTCFQGCKPVGYIVFHAAFVSFPRQLGLGFQGGAECVVHAARAYLDSKSHWHACLG